MHSSTPTEYNLIIFADYFQIYIEDALYIESKSIKPHVPKFDKEEMNSLLSVTEGSICIFTVRNMDVPLTIKIVDKRPDINFDLYDQIVEASITISSGILSISDVMEQIDNRLEFRISAGTYQALIGYQGLNTLRENELEGDDAYILFLWKAEIALEKKVLKMWTDSPYK